MEGAGGAWEEEVAVEDGGAGCAVAEVAACSGAGAGRPEGADAGDAAWLAACSGAGSGRPEEGDVGAVEAGADAAAEDGGAEGATEEGVDVAWSRRPSGARTESVWAWSIAWPGLKLF